MKRHIAETTLLAATLTGGCGGEQVDLNQYRTRVIFSEDVRADHPNSVMTGTEPANSDPSKLEDDPGIAKGDPIEPSNPTLNLAGEVRSITAIGEVYGWAVDRDDLERRLELSFYIDGPPGQGTLAGTATANLDGFSGGFEGNFAFQFQLPEDFRNASERQLFVFANLADEEAPVVRNAVRFTAYSPKQQGRNYYQNTLRPLLVNNCGGCHPQATELNYENHYLLLLSPAPSASGSATSNLLINKARGINHEGNNRCGNAGVNGNPCAQIQQWWNLEFN